MRREESGAEPSAPAPGAAGKEAPGEEGVLEYLEKRIKEMIEEVERELEVEKRKEKIKKIFIEKIGIEPEILRLTPNNIVCGEKEFEMPSEMKSLLRKYFILVKASAKYNDLVPELPPMKFNYRISVCEKDYIDTSDSLILEKTDEYIIILSPIEWRTKGYEDP